MKANLRNREHLFRTLREELVGPSPQGPEIDCNEPLNLTAEQAYGPFRQAGSGEEILLRDNPLKRYGVGVLYPYQAVGDVLVDAHDQGDGQEEPVEERSPASEKFMQGLDRISQRSSPDEDGPTTESESDDFDISSANDARPSTMGVTFLADIPPGAELVLEMPSIDPETSFPVNGRYIEKTVTVDGVPRTWWLRQPVFLRAVVTDEELCRTETGELIRPASHKIKRDGLEGLDIDVQIFSRPHLTPRQRLITVCIVNRTEAPQWTAQACLFQTFFRTTVLAQDGTPCILPYPSRPHVSSRDDADEEASLSLLYRNAETFATGHGCAANWGPVKDSRVTWVSAECLPAYEVPSTDPDVKERNGDLVRVDMAALATLTPNSAGFAQLERVVHLYESWIEEQEKKIVGLPPQDHEAAWRHIDECKAAATRMRAGLEYLATDSDALRAFQLANQAMWLQQSRSRIDVRRVEIGKDERLVFNAPYPDVPKVVPGQRFWRAFQIAFLLMSLRSVAHGVHPEREVVELIWFPTGGGKTEAYLGLAAFSMFLRRLRNPSDDGVEVLMRYTLRLLTAQQFQRASALLCAMEYLRNHTSDDLGTTEFSIGIWLGGSTTPNSRTEALSVLQELRRKRNARNKFLITKCPWCGAQMGPIDRHRRTRKGDVKVLGYRQSSGTVSLCCSDPRCFFSKGLPIYVIDDDVYEKRPSFVIGTVDKFAMLAWGSRPRTIFGLDEEGNRTLSPPGLIIQDELHLISGPLGSMVGLYESIIEELCTDRRGTTPIRPKIVCSTATIRRYREQVLALYGRGDTALFPPPGLEVSDSFFSRFATEPDGSLKPGRLYVGVHAPGLGSMQTVQVRVFSSLLQAPVMFDDAEKDPWWTLLIFFNSLRELGTTVSLFQSDIPDYMVTLRNRFGLRKDQMRQFHNPLELTGRLEGDDVSEALSKLEVKTSNNLRETVDVCFASNIIEVGVDIDRLSLMCVVGQPKTTSQYIQVTGRVGRRWEERPGLVVTLYGAGKPRDRSHFERFRSYHERLYAQVEPSSVTPFSPPALERALHAVLVSYVRQAGSPEVASSPYPVPEDLLTWAAQVILERAGKVDVDAVTDVERTLYQRIREWRVLERVSWGNTLNTDANGLLYTAGSYTTAKQRRLSWPTPMSMRSVDATCALDITGLYVDTAGDTLEEE